MHVAQIVRLRAQRVNRLESANWKLGTLFCGLATPQCGKAQPYRKLLDSPLGLRPRSVLRLRAVKRQSNCVGSQAETGSFLIFQSVLSRTKTLMMQSSLRI